MGEHEVSNEVDAGERRQYMQRLLTDVQALEEMLARGMLESGRSRIGAEQELVLIDSAYRPALCNMEIIRRLDDPIFTTELARFNLEFNLPPLSLCGDCLRRMESQIKTSIDKIREVAGEMGVDVLLTGILPTLEPSDLVMSSLTPLPRYAALNETLMDLRGGPFQFVIKGADELRVRQDSVMLEACNTSFQVHFQVSPEDFAHLYNTAQAISAPVLAAASNSPILFGKHLWRETRIAVFQQSVDARDQTHPQRELSPRVSFGNRWVRESAMEIYREDISRFRVLFVAEKEEDPFERIGRGEAPKLKALTTHNSTVYRWNRVCYGITDAKPHLRIENRYLPSGPTPIDEVANAAFWFGLLRGLSLEYQDITTVMDFDMAKANFFAAAQDGMRAQFTWLDGKLTPAQGLILRRLLPLAREGLNELGIDGDDIDHYLGIIEGRVSNKQTGAKWLLKSLTEMKQQGTRTERLTSITAAIARHQREDLPVHEWPLVGLDPGADWGKNFLRIEQYMTTDLFTVNEDEVIDLVANVMDWERIRHVPVEDNQHRLVGLVSYRTLLRFLAKNLPRGFSRAVAVSEIMRPDPITAAPETPTLEAIELMRRHGVSCLPVVKEGKLVGIVTENDFLKIAASLLEQNLRRD